MKINFINDSYSSDKTSTQLGEELNLDGMVAKLNYSDKSVGTTAYTVSGYDKTKCRYADCNRFIR